MQKNYYLQKGYLLISKKAILIVAVIAMATISVGIYMFNNDFIETLVYVVVISLVFVLK